MPGQPLHVVTGAFGFSGRYIAEHLLKQGLRVRTLTNSPDRASPLHGRIEAHPYHFEQPDLLVESLRGADVLYNTYWVRFNARDFRCSRAVLTEGRLTVSPHRRWIQTERTTGCGPVQCCYTTWNGALT